MPVRLGNAFLEQIVTNGRADYHALQTRVQRRLAGGLAFTLAYTWSKALGDFLDHLTRARALRATSRGRL